MKEILSAGRLRLYCNRPWQSAVIRRVLHGPVTAACPASLIRTHSDASVTVARYVAQIPDIRLR
jgi:glucosamine-6-phosphate deaminase